MAKKLQSLSTAEVLMQLNSGGAVEELQESLKEANRLVKQTGGKAVITLEFHISKNGDRGVIIKDVVKKRLPRSESENTMFYTDDDGSLFRRDPAQAEMFEQPAVEN
jgi:hypothetical protein